MTSEPQNLRFWNRKKRRFLTLRKLRGKKNQGKKKEITIFEIRKAKPGERRGGHDPQSHWPPEPYQTAEYPVVPESTASPPARRPTGFAPIAQTLAHTRSALIAPAQAPHATHLRLTTDPVPEQLAACIQEIATEFGDTRHLRSNLTHALRLLRASGLPESVFVVRLYDARAITKDRRVSTLAAGAGQSVLNPMAYFWTVVRDQLGLTGSEATSMSDASGDPTNRGRGEEWTNGHIDP